MSHSKSSLVILSHSKSFQVILYRVYSHEIHVAHQMKTKQKDKQQGRKRNKGHQITKFAIWRHCVTTMTSSFTSKHVRRTETKDRGIYPLDKQINRISISMLSMSALFFSKLLYVKLCKKNDLLLPNNRMGKRNEGNSTMKLRKSEEIIDIDLF